MTLFRVWSPDAHGVDVLVGDKRLRMTMEANDWWSVEAEAGAGDTYTFSVDGSEPLPDPRSPWQPGGVFGPSCLVDHGAFVWSDQRWQAPPFSSAIIYELHVGTFTREGTFDAAIAHLDHLAELGVTHVEIMPVAQFPGERGWGYDGVDLYAPQNTYGGPDGLKRLVDACHAHGLAVLLDVVYNHLGPSGNYLSRFGPYFTDHYTTPWGMAINLDGPGSDEVRRFICDNALMWLRDYHFDGLRLDAVHALLDLSAVHLLEQMATEVSALEAQLGRRLVLVAESDLNDPRLVRSREAGGYGLSAQWSDDFHHALHAALTGERDGYYADFGSLADLAHAWRRAYVYDGRYSVARQRRHGRPTVGLSANHFVVFSQNHDHIGNRARGERTAALLSPGRLRIAAALVCLSPFIPLLFQGEEWAASSPFQYFTDHQEPELAQAVREGRRREFTAFGWDPEDVPDPQAHTTFERSKLDWAELNLEPHASVFAWYRRLLRLRHDIPELISGNLDDARATYDDTAQWLTLSHGPITLACNLAGQTQPVSLPPGEAQMLFASEAGVELHSGAVSLPPDAVAILRQG
ncbi:MAG TPA: malto-oligosyltrehalose trehalohydrolase [Ktedonobacterales bacterium]|jgi:maltooligosyltrehalose trehalohydrolase|nr:malto-oligosyltrehalose trehalohydrolase [Ktedonobacterales bacterium]